MTVFDRAQALRRLGADSFDVVVVGGGITGCGVALDAALRGLRVALVEADDFASGTSSKSSKLVHGGLRYLAQRDFALVYEALAERQRLLRNAPHLVRPLPFLVPLFGRNGVVAKGVAQAYSSALWMYDLTGGLRIGKRHRRIPASEALRHVPVLNAERLVAAFLYWDAQADDARLTLAVARSAAAEGAVVVNHARVVEVLHDGVPGGAAGAPGAVRGVRLEDGTEVKARAVVNAGGVHADELAAVAGTDPVGLRPAKGVHLTVPADRLPCDYASVLSVPGDRRTVFVVPWPEGGFTYIGTTDTDYDGPLDAPTCTPEDRDYLLGAVNAWTTAALTAGDVTAAWAGLRPLVRDASSARSADLSRRHKVHADRGVVTVTGGKLTTYRRMAADTVDAVMGVLGRPPRRGRRRTRDYRLWGAETPAAAPATGSPPAAPGTGSPAAAPATGSPAAALAADPRLVRRYGSQAGALAAMVAADPSLAAPLVDGLPYQRAEVVYAVRCEMAVTLDDVLSRRLRTTVLDTRAALAAADTAAELMGDELGWSAEQRQAQVAAFRATVAPDLAAVCE